MGSAILVFIGAAITNNLVLVYFLGICPYLGVSNKLSSALGMAMATTFVMTLTAPICWLVYHRLLIAYNLPFLQYVVFIIVIASLVQLVEMVLRKYLPVLYRALGIYLPLITTNCAVLGLALFMVLREYTFLESLFFGFGTGCGFSLALLIMAGIREEIQDADIPEPLKGVGITLISAGLLALAFMGFSGMVSA